MLLTGDALLGHLLERCVHAPGQRTLFPHFGETRFVEAFDAARGISAAELQAIGAETIEIVPVDWIAPLSRMANLVSADGCCHACKKEKNNNNKKKLFASTLPPPPPAAGQEDEWAERVGGRLRAEAAAAFGHLVSCPKGKHVCSSCGALDYKLLRMLALQAVSAEQRAALLLPKIILGPDLCVDLRDWGFGRTEVDVFRSLARRQGGDADGATVLCTVCACVLSGDQGGGGGGSDSRTDRRTGTTVDTVFTSPDRSSMVVTIRPCDPGVSACRACGREGSVAAPLKSCAGCRHALYCSRECQVSDWPTHRPHCRRGDGAG